MIRQSRVGLRIWACLLTFVWLGEVVGLAQPDPAAGPAVSFLGLGWLVDGVQSPSLSLELLTEFPIRPAIDTQFVLRFPLSFQLPVLLTIIKLNSFELYTGLPEPLARERSHR